MSSKPPHDAFNDKNTKPVDDLTLPGAPANPAGIGIDFSYLRRAPDPMMLVAAYTEKGLAVNILNRVHGCGRVVVGVKYDETYYSAHPIAIYNRHGGLERIPTKGLLVVNVAPYYCIESQKPLRTCDEAKRLCREWVNDIVDGLPPLTE